MRKADNFSDVCIQTDSCALAGASAFLAGIPDSVTVVNGPIWCYLFMIGNLEMSIPGITERIICSQADNNSIVFGSEEILQEALKQYKANPPSLLCIENNCSASLIGDDTMGIAKSMNIDCPIVIFDSGGLSGGFNEGYIKAAESVFEALNITGKRDAAKNRVNLLGMTVAYYNYLNDRCEMERLLNLAGYEINACVGDGACKEKLENITDASLNIVVNEEIGLPLAKYLKEKYDMPYFSGLPPYGINGTVEWIDGINMCLPAPSYNKVIEEAVKAGREISRKINGFQSMWGELWFDEAVIAAPQSTAFGIGKALRCEWADIGKMTVITNDSFSLQGKEIIKKIADNCLTAGKDSEAIKKIFADFSDGLLMGSSNEDSLLRIREQLDIISFPLANPVLEHLLLTDLPFMGLRGAQNVLQYLWNEFARRKMKRSLSV